MVVKTSSGRPSTPRAVGISRASAPTNTLTSSTIPGTMSVWSRLSNPSLGICGTTTRSTMLSGNGSIHCLTTVLVKITHLLLSASICVPNTKQNVDLTNYGNAAPGTPVAIWGRWEGTNQTWRFEKGKCGHFTVSDSTLTPHS